MKHIDITDKVEIGILDNECLEIKKCACGKEFDEWISIYDEEAYLTECPHCKRKMFFRNSVTVYEVVDEKKNCR